ncbi:hypothetical protein NMB32_10535 [Stenotrophomonas sp. CD2]|nr:hypothetical protein NMB32_10535 [Stenotrophomonas sp. CD2]
MAIGSPRKRLADDVEAALLAASAEKVLVAAECRVRARKDRLQRDDPARGVHHRHQQGIVDVAEDQAVAVAHGPCRYTQPMCVDALAHQVGMVRVCRKGTVPQHVGGLGCGLLTFALLPFPFGTGGVLALPDRALFGDVQRGFRLRTPDMAAAGAPAAELTGRHVVSEQYGPAIAGATAVALHMEAHQRAIGVECVAAARIRHDAVRVHGLQERGNDVLRWVRCVHSTGPLGTWIGPQQPMVANALCNACRMQATRRRTDAAWSG